MTFMMNWIAGLIFDLELDCLIDEMETLKKGICSVWHDLSSRSRK